MESSELPDLSAYLTRLAPDLDLLRQNSLMSESTFLSFARDLGTAVSGVVTGDPGEFHSRGWLPADGADFSGNPQFHPFRVYSLHRVLRLYRWQIGFTALSTPERAGALAQEICASMPEIEMIEATARSWNRVVDLCVLLEPVYWPGIIGQRRGPIGPDGGGSPDRLAAYRAAVIELLRTLDPEVWRSTHESIRFDGAVMDGNDSLYLLLRLGNWSKRQRLKGAIAGGLWFRHIAEVLRRGFEDAWDLRWPEEDEAFGVWPAGARALSYGAERPLDDPALATPYLAYDYRLFTGSTVRWYVEGHTEYEAVLAVLPKPEKSGVELVNLGGELATRKSNAALKLRAMLLEDLKMRRFSIISFDADVAANVKFVRRQAAQGNIVGLIRAHQPDFEFANFSLAELVEIAAGLDEQCGSSGDSVRIADWTGVHNAAAFQAIYVRVSRRGSPGLKGQQWGAALAEYALKHPERGDDGTLRAFWEEIRVALRSRGANYDYQRSHFTFDQETLALVHSEESNDEGF